MGGSFPLVRHHRTAQLSWMRSLFGFTSPDTTSTALRGWNQVLCHAIRSLRVIRSMERALMGRPRVSLSPHNKFAKWALAISDALSSLAGTELAVDDWGVDLGATVANKGLAAPPGLSALTVSERAWEAIDNNPDTRGWYLDLRTWRRYDGDWRDWHPYPTTVPTGILAAVDTSLRIVLAEGLDGRIVRTRDAASRVREGLRRLGFRMFVDDDYASPITTAVYPHPDLPVGEMIIELREQHGIYIAGGLADLSGKIFRIGHMGRAIEKEETDLLLDAIAGLLVHREAQKESASVESASV